MSILKNGVLAEYTFLHNGVEMNKVLHNGVTELWVSAKPWTVDFMNYPLTEEHWDGNGQKSCTTTETYYKVSVKKNPDVVAFGALTASVVLPTQGCNKVKIKYTASSWASSDGSANGAGEINDVEVHHGDTDEYIIFDCDGDEFTLKLEVVDATAYYATTITVTEVSFYYE